MLANPVASEAKVDPRVRRTRQLLMQAFVELLKEKSFDSITVQEIADRATVNRATFYAHFEDKYVLLENTFTDWFKQTLYSRLPPGSEFTPANLQLLVQTVCEFLDQLQTHCSPSIRTQFDSLVERQAKIQLYEFLLAWFRKPRLARENDHDAAELGATITSWAIYGAALRWGQGDRMLTAEEFARQTLPLLMAGFGSPVHVVGHKPAAART
ncbi:MAG: TetR/AcrR family transcriptional regulator [Chloroflexi bacterium]|nr:TetR/AcrR family transcriptional regulator [Chloroflexota bacterium]